MSFVHQWLSEKIYACLAAGIYRKQLCFVSWLARSQRFIPFETQPNN
jgi:hypothetical protein